MIYHVYDNFFEIIFSLKNYYNVNIIGDMGETPLIINMPPNIIVTIIRNKNVTITTKGQEKCRISLLLTIIAR